MKTDKDLMFLHFDKYIKVYEANPLWQEESNNNLVCPSCDFNIFHINRPLSIENAFNKIIAHMLDTHNKGAVGS